MTPFFYPQITQISTDKNLFLQPSWQGFPALSCSYLRQSASSVDSCKTILVGERKEHFSKKMILIFYPQITQIPIDKNQSLVMELFGREQSGHFTLQSVFESA